MTFVVDIVTGASQGIGRAIAEHIAFQRGLRLVNTVQTNQPPAYSLVMVGRNTARGNEAAQSISKSTGIPAIFEECDLSNFDDVATLKERILERAQAEEDFQVGILVNNAAECPKSQQFVTRKQKNNDGGYDMVKVDRQFATNVLGYHFMMKMFQSNFSSEVAINYNDNDHEQAGQSTRIVNVASNWAGNLDLKDLSFHRRGYDNDSAYRQSKQCNRMQTRIWSQKLGGSAVVNSCHPGDPCTTLSKALGYNWGCPSPSRHMIEKQSPIPFLCGFGKSSIATTGGWFQGTGEQPMRCQFEGLAADTERLFQVCESFCS